MTDANEAPPGLRVPSEPSDTSVAFLPGEQRSVGQQLRGARMKAGLSLETLSARLKISVLRLQAFENDQFEQGPNLPIGRAMVASVARFLGLDAQALLSQLPQASPQAPFAAMQELAGGLDKETRLRVRGDDRGPASPVWWVALALLALAGLVYFYPYFSPWIFRSLPVPVQELAAPAATASWPVAQNAATPSTLSPEAPPSMPDALAPPAAPDRSASAAKSLQPLLLFTARGSTWIEVTDSRGNVLLRRTLGASETAEVDGVLPLSVVVGRADHTEVRFRGVAFPLDTYAQDNVARFKVP